MSSRTSAFLFHIVSQGKWGLDLNLIQQSRFLHGENRDLEKLVHLPKITLLFIANGRTDFRPSIYNFPSVVIANISLQDLISAT